MDIKFEECVVNDGGISLVAKCNSTFEEIERDLKSSSDYRSDCIRKRCIEVIAAKIAQEFLAAHKMDLINSISKEEIVNAVQIKIIENFSLRGKE